MISEARVNAIAAAMSADETKVAALLDMSPEAAAAEFKAQGYDFTAEELVAFAKYIQDNAGNGEIDEDQLDQVAGGSVATAVFVGGVIVGMVLNKKNVW